MPNSVTTPYPTEASPLIRRLVHRARMIAHVHDALQSSLDEPTLHRIIAATLISHRGMGFSRAMLFRHDPTEDCFRAAAAFGSLAREDHERILKSLEEEETLDLACAEPEGLELEWVNEETLFQPENVDRDHPAFWSRIIKNYETSNPLMERLEGAVISRVSSMEDTLTPARRLMMKVVNSKTCLRVPADEARNAAIPAPLKDILQHDSLWAILTTRTGPRLLLIVDKAFEENAAIDEIDLLHLDWFKGQAASAIETAELIADLNKTNEALKSLDTLKSNFLSTISHELRSPLTAITGFTRLLVGGQAGEIPERQKDLLDRVLAHSERLTHIINDLIEIAEIDAGIMVNVEIKPVDPLNILMALLPKLEMRRVSKKAEIEPVINGSVPLIRADEKRLERILHHLIDNAIKFSRSKGKVRIEFVPRENELEIRVTDQGIGIAPEKLSKIFESFYQCDNRMARAYEGMGIGLTLTGKLIAETGGCCKVESRLEEGTTFSVIYPRAG